MRGALRFMAASVISISLLVPSCGPVGAHERHMSKTGRVVAFDATMGVYAVSFRSTTGTVTIKRPGKSAALLIRELPGLRGLDLLYSVTSLRRSGSTYVMSGKSSWASFVFTLDLRRATSLVHLKLTVTPHKDAPTAPRFAGDVQLQSKSRPSLKSYAPAPPIAGTSIMVSSKQLDSTVLYFANLTSLGTYFDRSGTGAAQGQFVFPRAGQKGALVGQVGGTSFGYPVSAGDLNSLPKGRSTLVLDSYLALQQGIPRNEAAVAATYLALLGSVYSAMPKPSIPSANWQAIASKTSTDLLDPANLVTVNGHSYLRSYVSDTRASPELITQAGVLAGIKAWEARFHVSSPLDALLEDNLPTFYDPQFHTVVNGVGHDPEATGESWYFVTNMISLLRLTQSGSASARTLLLDSVDAIMSLARVNHYEFPQNFAYSTWNGQGTGLQPDVAGGYSWLMLGLYDLTKAQRYLDEAKASIVHVEGKGFGLAYETHMTGYAAAAAERLYKMTGDSRYRQDALLALANVFHVTRLWDCTYGYCRKGAGYHTYFGINPLPWSDYAAMLEQYEAWLALRDYLTYAGEEPSYLKDLVQGFVTNSPLTMQYSIPSRLPAGTATGAAGEYAFVPHNNLSWAIPLEDLRTGEVNSGQIGQEIYGAGGAFMFAAYGS